MKTQILVVASLVWHPDRVEVIALVLTVMQLSFLFLEK